MQYSVFFYFIIVIISTIINFVICLPNFISYIK